VLRDDPPGHLASIGRVLNAPLTDQGEHTMQQALCIPSLA